MDRCFSSFDVPRLGAEIYFPLIEKNKILDNFA